MRLIDIIVAVVVTYYYYYYYIIIATDYSRYYGHRITRTLFLDRDTHKRLGDAKHTHEHTRRSVRDCIF